MAKVRVGYNVTMYVDIEIDDKIVDVIRTKSTRETIKDSERRMKELRKIENQATEICKAVNTEDVEFEIYELIDLHDLSDKSMIWEY